MRCIQSSNYICCIVYSVHYWCYALCIGKITTRLSTIPSVVSVARTSIHSFCIRISVSACRLAMAIKTMEVDGNGCWCCYTNIYICIFERIGAPKTDVTQPMWKREYPAKRTKIIPVQIEALRHTVVSVYIRPLSSHNIVSSYSRQGATSRQ